MLGKTNAINKSVSGGSGDVVQAVNLTGELIHSGEKVWINKDTLINGEYFTININTSSYQFFGMISPIGNLLLIKNYVYEVGVDSATQIYTLPINTYKYGYLLQDGNNLFYQGFADSSYGFIRIGSDTSWTSDLKYYRYLGNGLALYQRSSTSFVAKIDIETGAVLYQSAAISIDSKDYCLFINNVLVNTDQSKAQAWLINDTGSSIEVTQQNPVNVLSDRLYTKCLFTTSDNKYALGQTSSTGGFKIISYDTSENKFTEYDMASAFPEFMEWTNSTNFSYSFDRDSGLLTFASLDSNSYAVFKYENGKFNKLIVKLPSDITVTTFNCAIGITRDLTILSFTHDSVYPNTNCIISSLTNDERYLIQSNAYYNIGETTLTGKANQDIPSGGTGEVSTVLPTYVPPKQYEVNEDASGGITFTSSATIIQGENGNTIFKQTPDVSINLGTDAQNIYEGFGSKENKTADEFCIRLRMFDTTWSIGNGITMLLSDNNYSQEPKPDGTLLLGYSAFATQEGIDSPIESEGAYILRFLNNELDYTCYTDLPEDKFVTLNEWFILKYKITYNADTSQYEYTTTILNDDGDILGTNTMTSSSGAVVDKTTAKILDYNLIGKPLFDVDLSQTGFKLNNEWVWRPVKEINK